jgi:hypothetical protein
MDCPSAGNIMVTVREESLVSIENGNHRSFALELPRNEGDTMNTTPWHLDGGEETASLKLHSPLHKESLAMHCFMIRWALVLAALHGAIARAGEDAARSEPGPQYVRIGHYQCVVRQGDFEANLKTLLAGLQLAREARLDIVSFPEAFLTGYFGREADARAVENGVYFVRGNNVVPGRRLEGSDSPGYGYGDSYVLDPNGQIVAGAGLDQQYLMIYNFDLRKKYRNQRNSRSIQSARELLPSLEEALKSPR